MGIYRVVSLIFVWQLAASICYYAVFAATPFFRDQFGLSGAAVGLVVTSLTLGYAVFLLPLGALTDRFGEHRTLTVGLLGLSLGSIFVAQAWSYPALLVSAFLLGSLYGTAMPGTNKAIFDSTPPGRQNLAVGVKQVGVTAGSGASALLVTGIAGVLYWEVGFYAAAASGLAVAVAFWFVYRGSGSAEEASYPDFGRLLGNRPYRSLAAAGVCLGAGLFTTTGYTILYIDESVGASVAFGGIVLAALQVSGSAGRVVTGWLSDALPGEPRRRIGSILLVQSLASAALFVGVAFVEGTTLATAAFVILGFFVLGFTGVYYSCMATLVSADEMGGATGGGQLALTSGALFAPPAFGYLSDAVGYRWSWLMLAALALVGAGFVVRVILTEPPENVTAAAD
ncbi:MFS transporter [Halopelagius fulvigenes]|uniref:MFS transporter n=1 Tax=Halopelagius fulvigenes TaxID=1198324 RepID=A0ABD5U284_9EURY